MKKIDSLLTCEIEKGFEEGDLTLEIVCIHCESAFSLDSKSVEEAIKKKTSFIDYLRMIRSSECPVCKELEEENCLYMTVFEEPEINNSL